MVAQRDILSVVMHAHERQPNQKGCLECQNSFAQTAVKSLKEDHVLWAKIFQRTLAK